MLVGIAEPATLSFAAAPKIAPAFSMLRTVLLGVDFAQEEGGDSRAVHVDRDVLGVGLADPLAGFNRVDHARVSCLSPVCFR